MLYEEEPHPRDFGLWKAADPATNRLLWGARTERLKLSAFAEDFFRLLAERLGPAMFLRKGEFHRLVEYMSDGEMPDEVTAKLDLLAELFTSARPEEES